MKNTTKNRIISINPQLMSSDKVNIGNATMCLNLRPSTGENSSALVAVGEPKTIAKSNATPFFMYNHANGDKSLFLKSGRVVSHINPDVEDAQVTELATLPAEPRCAIASGDTVLIMTDEGVFRMICDNNSGEWIIAGMMPELPPISIIAGVTSTFSTTIPARYLTGGYTRFQGNLTIADTNGITQDLLAAYNDLNTKATNAGYYIQPVMASYRLSDLNGNVIYKSAPIMVTADDGFQCVKPIAVEVHASSGVFSNVQAHNLTATGFRLGIVAPELTNSVWGKIVAKVEIMVTPQLHPIDFQAKASHRLESSGATTGILRMYLPGVANAMIPGIERMRERVVLTAESREEVSKTAAIYDSPLSGGIGTPGKTVLLDSLTQLSPKDETELLKKAISTSKRVIPSLLREVNIPHSFTAGVAMTAGDAIAWGDVTPIKFNGYPAGTFASKTGTGRWRACIKTTFGATDECVVWHSEGATNAPIEFSPFISYPHPNATEMTIKVSYDDGTISSRSFKLTPSKDGAFAYYLDSSFAPIVTDTPLEAYIIPAEVRNPRRKSSTMMSSKGESPLSINASIKVSQGRIVEITPAVRSSSSWDFARTHLYAFTSDGIYAVAIKGDRTVMSANIIEPRRVTSKDAVTVTPTCVYAIASGRLISVYGSKAMTVEKNYRFKGVGWCSTFNELWCITDDDKVLIMSSGNDGGFYFRDMSTPKTMFSVGGCLYISTNNCLADASQEVDLTAQNTEWKTRIDIGGWGAPLLGHRNRCPRLTGISWRLSARNANATVSLRGDGGAGEANAYPLLTLRIKGEINNPVTARIIAPARQYVTASVKGVEWVGRLEIMWSIELER